jgi:hypothetical protein
MTDELSGPAAVLGAGTGPHAFVADLDAPELDDDDRHHCARGLRVRVGDPMTVSDGAGRWRSCRFGPELEPDGPVVVDPDPVPLVTIGFALVKGERPELIVEADRARVDSIVPFVAALAVRPIPSAWPSGNADAARSRAEPPQPAPCRGASDALRGARRRKRRPQTASGPPSLDRPTILIGPGGGRRARPLQGPVDLRAPVLRRDGLLAARRSSAMRCWSSVSPPTGRLTARRPGRAPVPVSGAPALKFGVVHCPISAITTASQLPPRIVTVLAQGGSGRTGWRYQGRQHGSATMRQRKQPVRSRVAGSQTS